MAKHHHALSICALLAVCCGLNTIPVVAQPTNGISTVVQDTLAAGGGQVGSGNPMSLMTILGEPIGGSAGNGTFTIRAGFQAAVLPLGTKGIAVEGTIDDPTAQVTVNGISATITGTSFRAEGILLIEGPNTITATAIDPAGNRTTKSITVHLDLFPPVRPTAVAPPAVTTTTSYTLTGTKTPGTSIWINGVQVVPLDNATTWSATVSLVEGDNILVITTKDAAGKESASNTINIIVDNLPPVITVSPTTPAKTNFNPFTLTGTVDDSLTHVKVNGLVATRSGRNFEVPVPLLEGPNTLTIIATSPNGHVATKTLSMTLGTIPTLTSFQPTDGTKLHTSVSTTITISATDKESDPLQYQVLLDGAVLVDWTTAASNPWTPTLANRGLHALEVRVRDEFGGYASKSAQIYVARKPVPPLSP